MTKGMKDESQLNCISIERSGSASNASDKLPLYASKLLALDRGTAPRSIVRISGSASAVACSIGVGPTYNLAQSYSQDKA